MAQRLGRGAEAVRIFGQAFVECENDLGPRMRLLRLDERGRALKGGRATLDFAGVDEYHDIVGRNGNRGLLSLAQIVIVPAIFLLIWLLSYVFLKVTVAKGLNVPEAS
ncbi:MAG: hypothetical protein IE910_00185 [Brevundimonas sp.]|nr:hypothetical protein [Brevundimonas sp.]